MQNVTSSNFQAILLSVGVGGSGWFNHIPYLLSISVSMALIKDFSTYYMKALGLNQAFMLLKLCNNYYIVLICSLGSITGNILQL